MSVDAHRRAEALMAEGELLEKQGLDDQASPLFIEAARCEADAFVRIPISRPKTRGVIAISAVSLFQRGGAFGDAIRHAHLYLADEHLAEFAYVRLDELLEEARRARFAHTRNQRLSPDGFEISLRGSAVDAGFAPGDTVSLKIQQLEKYAHRICELVADRPFRTQGAAPPEITRMCQLMVTEPSYGSYRFGVRLATSLQPQLPLFSQPAVNTQRIAAMFFGVLDSLANVSPDIKDQVEDERYREVLLKLVRNLGPDGKDLSAVEVRRVGGGDSGVAVLTPRVGRAIDHYLQLGKRRISRQEGVQIGVLRALDLNRRWIDLFQEGSQRLQRCYVAEDQVVDDVVGPYVNRLVRVPGYYDGTRFYLRDILLETGAEAQDSTGS